MKKQIVAIHGGTTFDTYNEYISYLKNKKVDLSKFKMQSDWKSSLQTKLGNKYEVILPRMPNGTNAKYKEWKIWFERLLPLLNNNVVFIGHSLGGIFLAKYFSENILSKKVKALILVAAPFDDEDDEDSLADFILPKSLKKISKQIDKIYLIQSKDDPVVPFAQVGKYKKALPSSNLVIFKNRQHFNQNNFPEMVKLLKSL